MRTFAEDVESARRERIPEMALRPRHDFPEEMDDIVVKDVEMFRAEAMDDDVWWMCCYLRNGELVAFWVTIDRKPKRIVVHVTEKPSEWINIDARAGAA